MHIESCTPATCNGRHPSCNQRANQEAGLLESRLIIFLRANGLVVDWGQTIFQTANEMVTKTTLVADLGAINSKLNAEKEWWESKNVPE